ncbi:hypothetical protein H0H92_012779 [Tricholoma furcatifolium]|nr:hypothetical protein H0H92_012779 [Tricholoma furcatifolium]
MPKNRFVPLMPSHPPPPSPPNTLSYDDDDNDICPVCDGECTCSNRSLPLPTGPLSMDQLSSLHVPPPPPPPPPPPSLKIKLNLTKRTAPPIQTTSAAEIVGDPFAATQPIQKRRGRPPKAVAAARKFPSNSHPSNTLQSQSSAKHSSKQPPRGRPTLKKSTNTKRRRVETSTDSSDLSNVEHPYPFDDDDDDDDNQSIQFPTFVSASAMSSRASSSSDDDDSSDLSSLGDTDSSIEAEEEKFIMNEMQGRARVRRELLGEDVPKKRDPHNAWVIRPRKKSVGPSDVEMEVDSDATEDEDEEDEDEDAADDEETDARITGAGYVGLATGWSEDDDESSFDADLFFANLSSHDSDSTSLSDGEGDDGDHSDMDSMMDASITSLPLMPPELEVQERWDGQIVFTNGLQEGQGILDMDFEAHAASLAENSLSQGSDVEMSDVDDGGYEEDADEGDGETTDEELVGEDDLPNERAMRLFNTPFSVSAINPMSTMSPAVSPGPRDRRPYMRSISSPKPADILSGKLFSNWDSDDHDEYEDSTTKSASQVSVNGQQGPRFGFFVHTKECRQAIIDDHHQNVPSPHPRFRRRRRPSVDNLVTQQQLPVLPCSPSPFHLVTPSVHKAITMSPELTAAELVDLNDVLEASFLDTEPPSDAQTVSTDNESRKQLKSFNRWDLISVGAFRHSREGADGWGSDSTPGNKTDYGSMMKSSPLSTMLWQNRANGNNNGNGNKNPSSRARRMSVIISPVILPVRDRDGDRTPTNLPPLHQHLHQQNQRQDNYPHKSRKELRRERKLKRKSYGAPHQTPKRHQHHHNHQHHPNLKSRATSSAQRNFFSSSVPPLNI